MYIYIYIYIHICLYIIYIYIYIYIYRMIPSVRGRKESCTLCYDVRAPETLTLSRI